MNKSRNQTARLTSLFLAFLLLSTSSPLLAQAPTSESAEIQGNNLKRLREPFKLYLNPEIVDKNSQLVVNRSTPSKDGAAHAAKMLSTERVQAILAKLPPMPISREDGQVAADSAIVKTETEEQSTRSSAIRKQTSEEALAKPADSAPLQVIYISHRDKVEQIRQLSVTFSKPMVPIGQIAATDAEKYIKLTPQPSGQWQWADPATLIFIPENERFPQATSYEVTIPDSVVSLDGSKLAKTIKWSIETPTVRVREFYPQTQPRSPQEESPQEKSPQEGSLELAQGCQPALGAVFNQDIEPENLIKHITLVANSKSYALRLAKNEKLGIQANGKNWIAFKPVEPLPKGCIATVRFDRNLPSAEGPLQETSKDAPEQTYQVRIYGPLRLTNPNLKGRARSRKDFEGTSNIEGEVFSFSNPIDMSSFHADMVKVTPPLAQQNVQLCGNKIIVSGQFDAFSQYSVAFSESITDKFGQKLGHDCIGLIKTGKLGPLVKANKEFQSIQPGNPITPSFWAQGGAKLKVTVRQVQAKDWQDFNLSKAIKPYGKVLSQNVYSVGKEGGDIKLDLANRLKSKYGHLLVEARLLNSPHDSKAVDYTWIQITDMALDSFRPSGSSGLTVYANRLSDAAPIEGVYLTLGDTATGATTDKNGIATIKMPPRIEFIQTLIGKKGEDSCLLTEACLSALDKGEVRKSWYLTADRSVYRPGEKCFVKGWVREVKQGKCLVPAKCLAVHYKLTGNNQNIEGDAMVDSHGGFAFQLSLPNDLPLGHYLLTTTPTSMKKGEYGYDTGQLFLKVEEFRKNDLDIHLSSSSGENITEGQDTIVTSKASYLAGGLVANSPVQWTVESRPLFFRPEGWHNYVFREEAADESDYYLTAITKTVKGTTSEKGESKLLIKTLANSSKIAMSYCCKATVTDINRQEWSKELNLVTHPSDIYVGINTPNKVLTPGELLQLNLVAVDRKGTIQPTKVELAIKEYDQSGIITETRHESLDIKTKAETIYYKPSAQAEKIKVEVWSGLSRGSIQKASKIKASTIVDIKPYLTKSTFNAPENLCTLTADKPFYNPGEVAEITIQTSVYPSNGLLFSSNGQMTPMPLRMEGPAKTIKIPITEDCFPSFHLKLFLAKNADTLCEGDLNVLLPLSLRRLDLTAKPTQPITLPGKETTIDIELKDQNKPVQGGQIALAVVDEAVLTLNDYRLKDPLHAFYGNIYNYTEGRHSRNLTRGILLTVHNSGALARPTENTLDQAKESPNLPFSPGNLRRNFSAVAFFKPDIQTDANGKAQVRFKLPDSIARYRIMAVAGSKDKFGAVEDSLTSTIPIAIKPSPPRFLNLGDQAEISMVLQNLSEKEQKVEIALRSDKLAISDPGKEVFVPANNRVEVRFPAKAMSLGNAHLQCAMTADTYCDATECSLPILLPQKNETIAKNGVLAEANEAELQTLSRVEPLVIPDDALDHLGGLTLSTSASAIQQLAGSFEYLRDYPYDCTEQISARLLVLLSMNDKISALLMPKEKGDGQIETIIRRDIERLCSRQEPDGSFRLWDGKTSQGSPFASIQAISALKMAVAQKYAVNGYTIEIADTYLKNLRNQIKSEYDEKSRVALLSYALNVRHANKDTDSKAAKALLAQVMPMGRPVGDTRGKVWRSKDTATTLSTEAAAWLLPVIAGDKNSKSEAEILRKLINSRITVNSTSADVLQDNYSDFDHCLFFSKARSEAVVLESLMEDQPQSPIIAKLVHSLQECKKNGKWANSQESSRSLQALLKYCKSYENREPLFQTQVWLNDNLLSEDNFAGNTNKQASIRVPMNKLKDQNFINLKLEKTGKGKLFYRIVLDYTPKESEGGLNRGFRIERGFEAIDDKADVRRDEQGIWHIKAGARVKTIVRFSTPGERHHVALTIPLPAGTEASNSKDLITIDNSPEKSDQAITNWVDHQNLRDDRVEAFGTMLRAGHYKYECKMLATTLGRYRVPPAKIEEMYKNEIFGRSSTETVIIE